MFIQDHGQEVLNPLQVGVIREGRVIVIPDEVALFSGCVHMKKLEFKVVNWEIDLMNIFAVS